MSKVPQVSFYDMNDDGAGNPKDVDLTTTGWILGQIKADTLSDPLNVRIWNNRGGTDQLTNVTVTVTHGTPVDVGDFALVDDDEVVTNTAGDTTYTKGVDYEMDYVAGTITALASGSMSDASNYLFSCGVQEASYMQDCTVFVLDSSKNKTGEIVQDGWVNAICDSLGSLNINDIFKPLTDTYEHPIGAGDYINDNRIAGTANGGATGDTANYSDVTFRIEVPFAASHGVKLFYVGVRYFYT
jgi:hypothetical protein